jgi:hypothetical protein
MVLQSRVIGITALKSQAKVVAHILLNFLNGKQSIVLRFNIQEEYFCACIFFVNCSFGSRENDGQT